MKATIDRSEPVPLYYQLAKIIRESIENGDLRPGDMIPTETELIDAFDVSRVTVRHAVSTLEHEGFIRKERARGTFVQRPPSDRNFLGNLKCFSEEMQRKGIPHGTLELAKSVHGAEPWIADKLGIEPGDQIFYLKRRRDVDGRPILVVESYLPYGLFPGIECEDFNRASLYDLLEENYGIRLHHGHRLIEPKIVESEETIELLKIAPGTCLSAIESTIFTEDDRPVEFLRAQMIGKISIDLG